jgi:hypothetical protein
MSCKFDLVGIGEEINFLVSSLMYISKSLVHTSAGSPRITIWGVGGIYIPFLMERQVDN